MFLMESQKFVSLGATPHPPEDVVKCFRGVVGARIFPQAESVQEAGMRPWRPSPSCTHSALCKDLTTGSSANSELRK